METTKNQNNRRIYEFPVPWRPYEFEYNKIHIHGNIVRVYSNRWYYRATILETKPYTSYWKDKDLLVTFPDGTIRKFADDGCWGPDYVGCRLIVQGNDILVYNGKGDYLTIHTMSSQ
jgi:hypothetical protein